MRTIRTVEVEAHLLEQLRARVERTRAEVDAGDRSALDRLLGAAEGLSGLLDASAAEVSA